MAGANHQSMVIIGSVCFAWSYQLMLARLRSYWWSVSGSLIIKTHTCGWLYLAISAPNDHLLAKDCKGISKLALMQLIL